MSHHTQQRFLLGCEFCFDALPPTHNFRASLPYPLKYVQKVCFWDIKAGERRVKQHRNLKLICGGGEHVCIVAGPDEQGRLGIAAVL